VDAASHQLLLDHLLALGCQIRRFLSATARSNRSKNQELR
jgi:hypothetical protein